MRDKNMCDTLYLTREGRKLFAKNSDRHPKEPQYTWYALDPLEDFYNSILIEEHAGYRDHSWKILQKALEDHTNAYPALVSTPSWMWGAEMGINIHGVAIGNDAVFTNDEAPYRPDGLLGMDMLRIALHNAATAEEARDLLIDLLETYGQGGKPAYRGTLRYHNSFLITDSNAAYTLETADSCWAWRRENYATSISNAFSIRCDYDQICPNAQDYGQALGDRIDFKRCFQDILYSRLSRGDYRMASSRAKILAIDPEVPALRRVLRSHLSESIHRGMKSLCIHPDPLTRSATTSSMIVEYGDSERNFAWCTCSPFPCSSVYLPFPLPSGEPGELDALKQSKLPTTRLAGKRYAARARRLSPYIAGSRQPRREQILPLLQHCEDEIDELTLDWREKSFNGTIEFSEICYTACNNALHEAEKILGVRYDERHHTAAARW